MNSNRNHIAYQEAAVRNANAIELVIMLYDILARDLYGAVEAMAAGNIEARTAKLKHGLLVLQQLEGTLRMEEGGDFAVTMSRFYSMLRDQMMKSQIQQDPAILREAIQFLFTVREAWVEVNNRMAAEPEATVQTSSAVPDQTKSANWNA